MKEHHLTSNMRNSTEIHKLVEATKEVLKDKQTVFIHPKDSKIGDESRKKQENEEVSEEKDISKKQTKQESQEELENKRKLVENHSDYKMENRGENKKVQEKTLLLMNLKLKQNMKVKGSQKKKKRRIRKGAG